MLENLYIYETLSICVLIIILIVINTIKYRKKQVEKAKVHINKHNKDVAFVDETIPTTSTFNEQALGRALRNKDTSPDIVTYGYITSIENNSNTDKSDEYKGDGGGFGGGGASGTWDDNKSSDSHTSSYTSSSPSYSSSDTSTSYDSGTSSTTSYD